MGSEFTILRPFPCAAVNRRRLRVRLGRREVCARLGHVLQLPPSSAEIDASPRPRRRSRKVNQRGKAQRTNATMVGGYQLLEPIKQNEKKIGTKPPSSNAKQS